MSRRMRRGLMLMFAAIFIPAVAWFVWGTGYVAKLGLVQSMQGSMRLVFAVREPTEVWRKTAEMNPGHYFPRAQPREVALPFKYVAAAATACFAVGAWTMASGRSGSGKDEV